MQNWNKKRDVWIEIKMQFIPEISDSGNVLTRKNVRNISWKNVNLVVCKKRECGQATRKMNYVDIQKQVWELGQQ